MIPKAFVSYSHDSQSHKKWVMDFSTRLRSSGVDAVLDQWELKPGDDLPSFMEKNLQAADRVLMICTDRYVEKANGGTGGVGYEKMIVTADLLRNVDSNKVIPIIRQNGTHSVPTFLQSKLFIDFSINADEEFGFDELLRTILNAPLFVKPEIGHNPFQNVHEQPVEKRGDPVFELMKLLVAAYDRSEHTWISYDLMRKNSGMSRLLLDYYIDTATSEGLLSTDTDGDIFLTEKGRYYAVQHKLVGG